MQPKVYYVKKDKSTFPPVWYKFKTFYKVGEFPTEFAEPNEPFNDYFSGYMQGICDANGPAGAPVPEELWPNGDARLSACPICRPGAGAAAAAAASSKRN